MIDHQYPDYSRDVQYITDLYYAVRYGQHQLQQEELLSVENKLREIRRKQHNLPLDES